MNSTCRISWLVYLPIYPFVLRALNVVSHYNCLDYYIEDSRRSDREWPQCGISSGIRSGRVFSRIENPGVTETVEFSVEEAARFVHQARGSDG